jgi:transposase
LVSVLARPEGRASQGSSLRLPRLDACRWLCRVRGHLSVQRHPRSRPAQAHVRRRFVDVHRAQGSAIAEEAIRRIAQLYAVEKEARGAPPDRRVEIRQAKAAPIFDGLESWMHEQLPTISGKSPLAMAIRYGLTRMKRLRPYLDHGVLELDNNTAERAMRSVAVGRKNYLFVGSQTGGRAAAIAYTLIETAKLNGVDPQGWLADTLACIPDYKITRVDDLLPWNWSNHAA